MAKKQFDFEGEVLNVSAYLHQETKAPQVSIMYHLSDVESTVFDGGFTHGFPLDKTSMDDQDHAIAKQVKELVGKKSIITFERNKKMELKAVSFKLAKQ